MEEGLYYKDNLRILGYVFKRQREKRGYSLRGVASSIRLAHTVVSEIENGKVQPNIETLSAMYDTLSIEFCTDEEILNSLKQKLVAFQDAIYYLDESKMQNYEANLKSNESLLLHSPLRVDYLLTCSLYNLEKSNWRKPREEVLNVKEYSAFLSPDQKQIFHLINGVYHMKQKNHETALSELRLVRDFNNQEKITALGLLHTSYVHDALFNNHTALEFAEEASRFFTQHHNILRKIDMDMLRVKKTIDIGDYRQAENIIKNLENILRVNHYSPAKKRLLVLMKSFLEFSRNNMDKAVQIVRAIDVDKPIYTFYKAMLSYVIGDKKKAVIYLNKTIELRDNLPHSQFICAAYLFLDYLGEPVDEAMLEESVDVASKSPYAYINIHLHYFIYDLMSAYYKKRKKWKEAYYLTETWLMFSKKRDMYVTKLKG